MMLVAAQVNKPGYNDVLGFAYKKGSAYMYTYHAAIAAGFSFCL